MACRVPRAGLGDQHLPRHGWAGTGRPGTQWGLGRFAVMDVELLSFFEPSSGLSRNNPKRRSVPPRPWSPGLRRWRWGLRQCPSTQPPAPCRAPGAGTPGAAFWVKNATHGCGSWAGGVLVCHLCDIPKGLLALWRVPGTYLGSSFLLPGASSIPRWLQRWWGGGSWVPPAASGEADRNPPPSLVVLCHPSTVRAIPGPSGNSSHPGWGGRHSPVGLLTGVTSIPPG